MIKIIRNIYIMLRYICKDSPLHIPIIILSSLLRGIVTIISVVFLKTIIDALENKETIQNIVVILLGFTLINLIISIFNVWITQSVIPHNLHIIKEKMLIRVFDKTTVQDFESFEISSCYDKIKEAQEQVEIRVDTLLDLVTTIITGTVNIGSLVTLLMSFSPIIVLSSVISVIISLIFNSIIVKNQHIYYETQIPLRRKSDYIIQIGSKAEYAKDVRLYPDFKNLLKSEFEDVSYKISTLIKKHSRKYIYGISITNICNQVVSLSLIVFLIKKVLLGWLSLGDFIAAINSVQQLTTQILALVQSFPDLYKHSLHIEKFLLFMNTPNIIENSHSLLAVPNEACIEFCHVFFRYPNSTKYALEDFSLTLKPNEKTLIVGCNGSGKSTIIKLLARLYEPTEGFIYINGIDYRKYDIQSLRSTITFLFQDYIFYPFSIKENITMGDRTSDADSRLLSILHNVNMYEIINTLPRKENTNMLKEFDDEGILFSGGQYQRLAIAKALFHQKSFLVLDEPSSALDPIAEQQIESSILENTSLKSVLIITHRLSLAEKMDKIVCIKNGKVAAMGHHEELIKNCMYYKDLYNGAK